MGSNYFGDQNYLGNERGAGGLSSSSSSSSSRKGKKSGSDKPKQPQRGLGVAQLEKIRLHSQLGCTYLPSVHHNPYASTFTQEDMRLQTAPSSSLSSSSFSYSSSSSPPYGFQGHHGVMMGLPDLDGANLAYGDSQPTNVARWHQGNAGYGTQHFVEPSMTRSFFEAPAQGSHNMNMKDGSSSLNSESSSSQEIDLELKLSL
ncbi:protein SPEAR1-like [Salvia miltiorrhiza]|uniref:protein SPEAR1-like n=1 Tax=Salvia miltiorrhiza TaxID=226208 RepID=UPI0025AB754D|nr:protein SPEAR1-like [Salvia miltiorrhiza]XP_057785787.1 protein SPEAR1-like [Salvia miltiorrhiza]